MKLFWTLKRYFRTRSIPDRIEVAHKALGVELGNWLAKELIDPQVTDLLDTSALMRKQEANINASIAADSMRKGTYWRQREQELTAQAFRRELRDLRQRIQMAVEVDRMTKRIAGVPSKSKSR